MQEGPTYMRELVNYFVNQNLCFFLCAWSPQPSSPTKPMSPATDHNQFFHFIITKPFFNPTQIIIFSSTISQIYQLSWLRMERLLSVYCLCSFKFFMFNLLILREFHLFYGLGFEFCREMRILRTAWRRSKNSSRLARAEICCKAPSSNDRIRWK